ncbi:uncharacterized protein F5Z01DRAFT_745944 [Emericellopsis atlantica]|uniref:Tr-type G domain-containing protein n=1 Tax=Emericellopsis atlantica TaxID=2614577 RepID=A0A9P7ZDW2_9HYPO|nr:uncharacterized protein F5Z01DRAFT_745944 [Emericellopsis atlantica]KAG9249770.1 hypothetical protein F5Z01DRAFT_745944 [Emericellopsis atlantica]
MRTSSTTTASASIQWFVEFRMMQTTWTPHSDIVESPYYTQGGLPPSHLQPPTRPAPTPSTLGSSATGAHIPRARLPRTSSLLPPSLNETSTSRTYELPVTYARLTASTSSESPEQTDSPGGRSDWDRPSTTARSPARLNNAPSSCPLATPGIDPGDSGPSLSVSGSVILVGCRSNKVEPGFLLHSSPPSTKRLSQGFRGSQQPSDSCGAAAIFGDLGSESPNAGSHRSYIGLPAFEPLSPFGQDYSSAWDQRESPHSRQGSLHRPGNHTHRTLMPLDHGGEPHGAQGHSRSRSGKSSGDSGRHRPYKSSQKAMLSRALQKANMAVNMDNGKDFSGARPLYVEACELLQQILQKTAAQGDKEKLEAIQRTYTSRIEELDQIMPPYEEHKDAKALREYSPKKNYRQQDRIRHDQSPEANVASALETATVKRVVLDDAHDAQSRNTRSQAYLQPSLLSQSAEPGFLQSSFSRSPISSRFPDNARQMPTSAASTTSQSALAAQSADERSYLPRQPGESAETQLSLNGMTHGTHRGPEHSREDSQHSWLDPIDESGGSTGSSVHSRTSSLGYRRRQIRPASGGTEAEFDNALDEAIEAAYNDGYEPAAGPPEQQEAHDEVVANALRKVELARERVRQTGREAYELASERERERFQLQPQRPDYADRRDPSAGQFFDDSSDEEERILDEFTRDCGLHQEPLSRRQQPAMSSVPRESDSSGFTSRTWQSSIGSNPPGTGATTLSTVTESISEKALPIPPTSTTPPPPLAPPPTQALPEIPQQSLQTSTTQTVRNRRMSGQAHRQLKIETMKLTPPPPPPALEQKSPYMDTSPPSGQESSRPLEGNTRPYAIPRRTSSPPVGPSPLDTRPLDSPFAPRAAQDADDADAGRSTSPSISKLKKNFSSSSLRSLKVRNMSVSHLDEGSEMSPGTPTSSHWANSQTPMMPSIPPAVAVNLQKFDASMPIFDDNFHFPDDPGATDLNDPEAPISLEPCPTDFLLRPFWLMRCLFQTLVHPRGGYVSSKLFVPREAWKVKNVKLKNVEDKIANCDLLTAALLKLARVDTCDADAMLEEMQAIENILEQVQASLVRKLGNEVGVSNASAMFKEATVPADGEMAMPRSASVSGKSSFSWRRLRSKNSAATLTAQSRSTPIETIKEIQTVASLPMTSQPSRKPAKRDMSQANFSGPNASYMGSLARLFDAAQAIDQIARQVEDPGLKHADKTQVGLELCTRHAAEFFGFYIPMSSACWSTGRVWCLPKWHQPRCLVKRMSLPRASTFLFRTATRRAYYSNKPSPAELEKRIAAIPIERYRNFCIVAHIDHGKSTLSDRLLERTGTISASDANKQILDKLDVERERGITVKAQTCTMLYKHEGQDYLIHLVDTPGHVDFRAEVTRSYASCGGALLLVDASQGIQAQTASNFHLAFAQDLALVPVINKIDMPSADVPRVLKQIESNFELDPSHAVLVSAKTGKGVDSILPAVVKRIPHPVGDEKKPLKMLLVDSWYDNFKGVVLLVRIFDGVVKAGDHVVSLGTGMKYTVGQVGIQYPNATPQGVLRAGQVGYVFFNPGMKKIQDAKLGDTFTTVQDQLTVEPYPGFEEPQPMVFVAAFPTDQSDYTRIADSISQLVLNDRSVTLQKAFSEALGSGWRLGFLGSLHCSVFQDRLKGEHGGDVIITEPSVPSKIIHPDGSEEIIQNPALFPEPGDQKTRGCHALEPFVRATMTTPEEYLGRVIELCEANRGEQRSIDFFHTTQVIVVYDLPASQLVDDFFGKLKGATKGYATLDYEDAGWRESRLVKLQLLVNKQPVDAICRVVHTSQADRLARHWVTKFKEHVDRQMFEIVIQAASGNKVLARETIKPFRKDVLAKLHAADITRRKKLLEKQKEGRKRLRAIGNVVIEQSAFQKFLAK